MTMKQSWYLIEPLAPLVFRSGKPFGAGSRDGANFPWPSALAGLLRTQIMVAHGLQPWDNTAHREELQALSAAGPFLVECERGQPIEIWLPKPTDAVLLNDEETGKPSYVRLMPGRFANGAGSDLPTGLAPVVFESTIKGKPQPGPAWWPLSALLDWAQAKPVDVEAITQRCSGQPWQVERRTHVGINRATLASETGRLFQTEGLDFSPARQQAGGWQDRHFALMGRGPAGISPGSVTFGGERRLSWLAPYVGDGPQPPPGWANQLEKRFAITLATPALFSEGWKPGWLDANLCGEVPSIPGLRVRLRAAALERWQGISGWDLAAKKPRATRKAVPAGATYWFDVLAGTREQLEQLWLASICDDPQDRCDGFGIALPRPWQSSLPGDPTP